MGVRGLKSAPLLAVAVGGLVVGLAMPAAAHETKHLISGKDLKPNSVTGKQIKESTLGTVPRAHRASTVAPLTWHPLAFHFGWGNYDKVGPRAAYAIDAQGIVHLRGRIAGTTAGTDAFTLPANVVSENRELNFSVAVASGLIGELTISSGEVGALSGTDDAGATLLTQLDGVTFAAD